MIDCMSKAVCCARTWTGSANVRCLQERTAILQLHAACLPLEEDVELPNLAMACHGYSGADLAALCREAAMTALSETAAAFLEGDCLLCFWWLLSIT